MDKVPERRANTKVIKQVSNIHYPFLVNLFRSQYRPENCEPGYEEQTVPFNGFLNVSGMSEIDAADKRVRDMVEQVKKRNLHAFRILLWDLVGRLCKRTLEKMTPSGNSLVTMSLHWRSLAWSTWFRLPWYCHQDGFERYAMPPEKARMFAQLFEMLPDYLASPSDTGNKSHDLSYTVQHLRLRSLGTDSVTVSRICGNAVKCSVDITCLGSFDPVHAIEHPQTYKKSYFSKLEKVVHSALSDSDHYLLSFSPLILGAKDSAEDHDVVIVHLTDPITRIREFGALVFAFQRKIESDAIAQVKTLVKESNDFFASLWCLDVAGIAERDPGSISIVSESPDLETIQRSVAAWREQSGASGKVWQRYNFALPLILAEAIPDSMRKKNTDPKKEGGINLDQLKGITPNHANEWAMNIDKNWQEKSPLSLAASLPRGWLTKITGASQEYLSFLRRVLADVRNANAHKPLVLYLYSEPGCGKEMLSEILHFAHVLHVLFRKVHGKTPCESKENEHDCDKPTPNRARTWRNQKIKITSLLTSKGKRKGEEFETLFEYLAKSYKVVHCGELPKEAEDYKDRIFGTTRKPGPFVLAGLRHGTVFLDEFNTMEEPRRADLLLRALDPGIISLQDKKDKNGETKVLRLAPLVVVASNVPKERLKESGFNEAVVNRVSQHYYEIPPLRRRKEDILLIFDNLLNNFEEFEKRCGIDLRALQLLVALPWAENLRQLKTVVEHLGSSRRIRGIMNPHIEFDEVLDAVASQLADVPTS